jgi:hypothetical protein
MTNPLQQLEQKLQAQAKRIGELEVKYAQLLEDLKALRGQMAKPLKSDPATDVNTYRPAFDRWPGAER